MGQEAADIGESACATGRDAVGGESGEEFAEDVVDIDLSDEIAGGAGELGGEIVFALRGFGVLLASVRNAETAVFRAGGETAESAVGEFLGAEVEWVGGTCVRHKLGVCGLGTSVSRYFVFIIGGASSCCIRRSVEKCKEKRPGN